MTQPSMEEVSSLPFCGGRLVLLRPVFPMDHYDDASPENADEGRLRVLFVTDGASEEVHALSELGSLVRRRGCRPTDDLARREADFAVVLSTLLRTGRVITDTDLYSFVEEKFDVRIADSRPRREGDELRFLAGDFRLDGNHELREVHIDLASFQARIVPLSRRKTGEVRGSMDEG